MVKELINTLIEITGHDPKVIILVADDIEVYTALSERFPDRTINIGISECNAISMGAGLSSCGHIPFVVGGNSFMAYRAYEFVRNQLCMQNRNVKVIGIGAGMAISVLGNAQHATEDIGALRVLPGLTIMTPATPKETREMVCHSINIDGPTFIRIGRSCGIDFYNNGHQFEGHKIQMLKNGKDIAAFSAGSMVCQVLDAAREAEKEGIKVGVFNVHTIKPLDKETLVQISGDYHKWISVEEHNVIGGLGSALSEVIVDERADVHLKKIGLNDVFATGYGIYDDIKKINSLGIEDIVQAFREMAKE